MVTTTSPSPQPLWSKFDGMKRSDPPAQGRHLQKSPKDWELIATISTATGNTTVNIAVCAQLVGE